MSVSRRASFAAGIAAVRRDRRRAGRGGHHHNNNSNNDSGAEQQPPGRDPRVTYSDASNTITVVAGAVPLPTNHPPSVPPIVISPQQTSSAVILAPPTQADLLSAAGQTQSTVLTVKTPSKGKSKSKKGKQKVDPMALDMTRPSTAFAAVAKAATVASKKPRIQYEVRPFTKESLEKINIRTSNLIRDYGFLPKRSPNLQDGAQLPAKYEPFPKELLGKPVEELDQYVYEKVGWIKMKGTCVG